MLKESLVTHQRSSTNRKSKQQAGVRSAGGPGQCHAQIQAWQLSNSSANSTAILLEWRATLELGDDTLV